MTTPRKSTMTLEEAIRRGAYEIYEQLGRRDGMRKRTGCDRSLRLWVRSLHRRQRKLIRGCPQISVSKKETVFTGSFLTWSFLDNPSRLSGKFAAHKSCQPKCEHS